MNTKQESTTELPLLSKLPRHELETLVNSYIAYGAKYKYVYFLMLGFVAIIVIYNIGFGGRSFSVEDARSIENGLIGVILVFLVIFIGYAGYVISHLIKLKKQIKHLAEKNKIDKKPLRKEFHLFVKATIGGPGLR